MSRSAVMAPALWMVGSQLYTTVKHVNPVKIRYSPAAVFVTLEAWRSIPETYRQEILSIYTGRSLVRPDLSPGLPKNILAPHFVVQTVELRLLFLLGLAI